MKILAIVRQEFAVHVQLGQARLVGVIQSLGKHHQGEAARKGQYEERNGIDCSNRQFIVSVSYCLDQIGNRKCSCSFPSWDLLGIVMPESPNDISSNSADCVG